MWSASHLDLNRLRRFKPTATAKTTKRRRASSITSRPKFAVTPSKVDTLAKQGQALLKRATTDREPPPTRHSASTRSSPLPTAVRRHFKIGNQRYKYYDEQVQHAAKNALRQIIAISRSIRSTLDVDHAFQTSETLWVEKIENNASLFTQAFELYDLAFINTQIFNKGGQVIPEHLLTPEGWLKPEVTVYSSLSPLKMARLRHSYLREEPSPKRPVISSPKKSPHRHGSFTTSLADVSSATASGLGISAYSSPTQATPPRTPSPRRLPASAAFSPHTPTIHPPRTPPSAASLPRTPAIPPPRTPASAASLPGTPAIAQPKTPPSMSPKNPPAQVVTGVTGMPLNPAYATASPTSATTSSPGAKLLSAAFPPHPPSPQRSPTSTACSPYTPTTATPQTPALSGTPLLDIAAQAAGVPVPANPFSSPHATAPDSTGRRTPAETRRYALHTVLNPHSGDEAERASIAQHYRVSPVGRKPPTSPGKKLLKLEFSPTTRSNISNLKAQIAANSTQVLSLQEKKRQLLQEKQKLENSEEPLAAFERPILQEKNLELLGTQVAINRLEAARAALNKQLIDVETKRSIEGTQAPSSSPPLATTLPESATTSSPGARLLSAALRRQTTTPAGGSPQHRSPMQEPVTSPLDDVKQKLFHDLDHSRPAVITTSTAERIHSSKTAYQDFIRAINKERLLIESSTLPETTEPADPAEIRRLQTQQQESYQLYCDTDTSSAHLPYESMRKIHGLSHISEETTLTPGLYQTPERLRTRRADPDDTGSPKTPIIYRRIALCAQSRAENEQLMANAQQRLTQLRKLTTDGEEKDQAIRLLEDKIRQFEGIIARCNEKLRLLENAATKRYQSTPTSHRSLATPGPASPATPAALRTISTLAEKISATQMALREHQQLNAHDKAAKARQLLTQLFIQLASAEEKAITTAPTPLPATPWSTALQIALPASPTRTP